MSTQTVKIKSGEEVTFTSYPWWLFWLASGYTITLSPKIYTDSSYFGTEQSKIDDLVFTAEHEIIHVRQQIAVGRWKFFFKYLFSRSFRYNSELPAYIAGLTAERNANRDVNASVIAGVASDLSSWTYLWCVNKNKAIADLTAGLAK